MLEVAGGRWRTAVSFDARGPVPELAERNLAWPAPRRVTFLARFAGSDRVPGRYRLATVDPQTGKLTPSPLVLAGDASPGTRLTPRFLGLDASGRYLLYGVDGTFLRTSWLDLSNGRAPVRVARFDALSTEETRAYESGAW